MHSVCTQNKDFGGHYFTYDKQAKQWICEWCGEPDPSN